MKAWKLILLLALWGATACKQDNPEPLRLQLKVSNILAGAPLTPNQAISAGGTGQDVIKGLMIGTLAVSSGTPWRLDQITSGDLLAVFGSDLRNSEGYFVIYELPVSGDYLSLELPPENGTQFQVLAVGLRDIPPTPGQTGQGAYSGAAAYIGLSDQLYTSTELANGQVHINLSRACMVAPTPLGCASFGPGLMKSPIVSSNVEIVGFKVNGVDYTTYLVNLPLIVNSAATETAAIASLVLVRDEMIATGVNISSLSILTTHRTSPRETDACRALIGNADANNTLHRSYCEVQEYKISY